LTSLTRVITAHSASTKMSTAITTSMASLLNVRHVVAPHDGGGATHLDDPDAFAGEVLLVAVEGPRGPQLTVDLDEAVVGVHLFQHGGLRALDRLHAERRLTRLERGALMVG